MNQFVHQFHVYNKLYCDFLYSIQFHRSAAVLIWKPDCRKVEFFKLKAESFIITK